MKYRVSHTTEFRYEARVGLCYNLARIRPRVLPRQQVGSAILRIDPLPHDHSTDLDYFGNRIDYFSIQQPHDQLAVGHLLGPLGRLPEGLGGLPRQRGEVALAGALLVAGRGAPGGLHAAIASISRG